MPADDLTTLMEDLLKKAETARANEWRLTAAEALLMLRLAGALRVTLPAAVLLSGAATASFLRFARSAVERGQGRQRPEPMVS
jgi:hypothetical protein